ncbi:phosphate signaling complex protein PhoU [Candidatus Contubernalis alkaliaceticus]|uniref:phosphate signaling complex protein PhoU n=1 Tax=Candidatus Contubernalis alkaliaceticus TaxID=338645 RepID=UPI001F4BE06F|nr:phosphate signaling complex protein PhoU [Candidatus Contubernalis alkalaceticus]UNC90882.1 phosphate signaling complex protein PhoU [Candidatus Contubernalis alkalaceticus]
MARKTFDAELDELQKDILKLGGLVEQAIFNAVKSLVEKNAALAREVIDNDDIIDQYELDIEHKCLTLIARQQPIARDLRTIGTALKIITDLERMADHATDTAKVTKRLEGQEYIKPLIDIPHMAQLTQKMVSDSLQAFIRRDTKLALQMIEMDHQVDHLYRQIFRELLVFMMEDPRTITQATYLLIVARNLERIADHATNLGEWIIYMVTGVRKEKLND